MADFFEDYEENDIYDDDDLMPVTDTWRDLHPYEYNPFDRDDPWGNNYRDKSFKE